MQSITKAPLSGPAPLSLARIRTLGIVLIVLGLLLALGMLVLLSNIAPSLLHPGQSFDGSRFTGTAAQGLMVLTLLGWVGLSGVMFTIVGVVQARTQRRPMALIYVAGGMIVLTVILAIAVTKAL